MHIVIILLMLVLLILGPQWWAKYTFRRYDRPLERIPGTGGELARHLLDRFQMPDVPVEKAEQGGDHYDPERRVVCLSPTNHDHNSLTAVAVAAHEVGHAIQHRRNEPKLALRHRLVKLARTTQQLGAAAMFLLPVAMLITRAPASQRGPAPTREGDEAASRRIRSSRLLKPAASGREGFCSQSQSTSSSLSSRASSSEGVHRSRRNWRTSSR